eukprot:SAG11_NODE_6269_length_1346_cov_2.362470_1_plen_270_part_10
MSSAAAKQVLTYFEGDTEARKTWMKEHGYVHEGERLTQKAPYERFLEDIKDTGQGSHAYAFVHISHAGAAAGAAAAEPEPAASEPTETPARQQAQKKVPRHASPQLGIYGAASAAAGLASGLAKGAGGMAKGVAGGAYAMLPTAGSALSTVGGLASMSAAMMPSRATVGGLANASAGAMARMTPDVSGGLAGLMALAGGQQPQLLMTDGTVAAIPAPFTGDDGGVLRPRAPAGSRSCAARLPDFRDFLVGFSTCSSSSICVRGGLASFSS